MSLTCLPEISNVRRRFARIRTIFVVYVYGNVRSLLSFNYSRHDEADFCLLNSPLDVPRNFREERRSMNFDRVRTSKVWSPVVHIEGSERRDASVRRGGGEEYDGMFLSFYGHSNHVLTVTSKTSSCPYRKHATPRSTYLSSR